MKNTVGIFVDTGDYKYHDDNVDALIYAIRYLNKKPTFFKKIKLFLKKTLDKLKFYVIMGLVEIGSRIAGV